MALLNFRGVASRLNLRTVAQGHPDFARLRRYLIREQGMSARRADQVLDGMLARVMHNFGDHFVAGKSSLLDRIVQLRDTLDTSYGQILDFSGNPVGGSRSLTDQLSDLQVLYRDLDGALLDLSRRVDETSPPDIRTIVDPILADIRGVDATPPAGTVRRPIGTDILIEPGRSSSRMREKNFVETAPGSGVWIKAFKEVDTEFRVVDGQYHITVRDKAGQVLATVREFGTIASHKLKETVGRIVQSHHGMQDLVMKTVFGRHGYNRDNAPTIWVRDSRSGSPHRLMSEAQNNAQPVRNLRTTTYKQIRDWSIADLKLAGAKPDEIAAFLRAFDAYFVKDILPKLSATERAAMLGGWTPPGGAP